MLNEEEETGIWCELCGEKILSLGELEKAKAGKIGFLDRRRMDWLKMVAKIGGIPTHNHVHTFAMMRVYRHFIQKHKKDVAKELKNGGKKIWDWLKIQGKEKMEKLGVHF